MRYIDADALLNPDNIIVVQDETSIDELPYTYTNAVKVETILNAPTADVVEVVRCKECKYCVDLIMGGLWCEHPDNRNPLGCRPNDYCNDGERREENAKKG